MGKTTELQTEGATTTERTPMPVPKGGWPADEYTGKGGSFSRDPYTGIRTPTPETLAAWAAAEAAEAEAAAAAARLKAELE
jgi:hypothetical protein